MDEHEALIEYSEMTTFNFNSEEFQKVKKDYLECVFKNGELTREENFTDIKNRALTYTRKR